MGHRTINSADALFRINNVSGEGVGVSGISLTPGETKTVAAWVFLQDRFRSEELNALAAAGRIQVVLLQGGYEYVLSAEDLIGLEAPIAEFTPPAYTTLPAASGFPVGYVVFDATGSALVTSDGSAWV